MVHDDEVAAPVAELEAEAFGSGLLSGQLIAQLVGYLAGETLLEPGYGSRVMQVLH